MGFDPFTSFRATCYRRARRAHRCNVDLHVQAKAHYAAYVRSMAAIGLHPMDWRQIDERDRALADIGAGFDQRDPERDAAIRAVWSARSNGCASHPNSPTPALEDH